VSDQKRRDGTPVTEPSPARHYSWPPFQPGHTLSLRHGAFSDRTISARALEIRELLLERYPYLADDAFMEAVQRYTRAEARALLLHTFIMEKVESDGVEAVRPYLWAEARGADALAQKCGQDCGLDPAGHAKIARDLGMAASVRGQHAALQLERLTAEGQRLALLRTGDNRG
jgi:hypothetical protein